MNRADGMVRLREGLAHLPWDYELRVDVDVRPKLVREKACFMDRGPYDEAYMAATYSLMNGLPVEVKAEGCDWATLTLDDFITAWAKLGLGTEDHDWDCDDADAAIQQALFGDLVFG